MAIAFNDQDPVATCGFFIHLDSPDTIEKTLDKQLKEKLRDPQQSVQFIEEQLVGIPYLSLADNLSLQRGKHQQLEAEQLSRFVEQLGLPADTLRKLLPELTALEKIKVQLLYALLYKTEKIIMNDVFTSLTVMEIQQLLPLLHSIARNEKICLIGYTANKKITDSPYIDGCI